MKIKKRIRLSKRNYKRKNSVIVGLILIGMLGDRYILFGGKYMLWTDLQKMFFPMLMYEQQYGKQTIKYAEDYLPNWYKTKECEQNKQDMNCNDKGNNQQKEKKCFSETNQSINEEMIVKNQDNEKQKNSVKQEKQEEGDLHKQVFTRDQLETPSFLTGRIFAVDSNTHFNEEELSLTNLLDTDVSVAALKEWDGSSENKKCKVLIYHTHGSEAFKDSRPGVKEDTIIGVGEHLAKLLETKYNIPVYHDTTVYDMINGVNDRSGAYENAYNGVTKILAENPSIEVAIDLHRDGVDEDTHLLTKINGKKTAKIMFLNGLSRSNTNGEIDYLKNPNRQMNLNFSFQLYLKGKELYGDYIRKIYVKSLRFNLHILPRTTLIEAGAQNNTIEEEKNAMEPLADILNSVLSGEDDK